MTQTLKVTMNKILVNDNGEAPGKGEFYWSLMVDDQVIDFSTFRGPARWEMARRFSLAIRPRSPKAMRRF